MIPPFPEVDQLLKKYETEPEHVFHVSFLTLQLFDQLSLWHQLTDRDRQLLHAAALLHDIGWSQTADGKGHHKESLRLIDQFTWSSISFEEKEVVAQTARYHRKSIPSPHHERFTALPPSEQLRVEKLAALLRIGDALDRTHRQLIQQVQMEIHDQSWHFLLLAPSKIDAEMTMAENKSNLLQKLSMKRLFFRPHHPEIGVLFFVFSAFFCG